MQIGTVSKQVILYSLYSTKGNILEFYKKDVVLMVNRKMIVRDKGIFREVLLGSDIIDIKSSRKRMDSMHSVVLTYTGLFFFFQYRLINDAVFLTLNSNLLAFISSVALQQETSSY